MPVRSLSSSVLRWPDAREVEQAVRRWAERVVTAHPEVMHIGYFGSYARGDWGPGSDLDMLMIVEGSAEPFERRAAQWDATELPVPVELVVYTKAQWERLPPGGRFYRTVMRETIWVYDRGV